MKFGVITFDMRLQAETGSIFFITFSAFMELQCWKIREEREMIDLVEMINSLKLSLND